MQTTRPLFADQWTLNRVILNTIEKSILQQRF